MANIWTYLNAIPNRVSYHLTRALTLDSPVLNFFSRFSDKSDEHTQKVSLFLSSQTSYVAIFPVVAVAAFSKMPVERSSALESRVITRSPRLDQLYQALRDDSLG